MRSYIKVASKEGGGVNGGGGHTPQADVLSNKGACQQGAGVGGGGGQAVCNTGVLNCAIAESSRFLSPTARIPISWRSPESKSRRTSPVMRCSAKFFEMCPKPTEVSQSITLSADQSFAELAGTGSCVPTGGASTTGGLRGGGGGQGKLLYSNPGGAATY
jgi:hypothetical protein